MILKFIILFILIFLIILGVCFENEIAEKELKLIKKHIKNKKIKNCLIRFIENK